MAQIIEIESGVAKDENFGVFADKGILTSSFHKTNSTFSTQHSTLFTLVLRANTDASIGDILKVTSRYTAAEAYNIADEIMGVTLNIDGEVATGENVLFQNNPNPFQGETVIGFVLAEAQEATLTVQDVSGRILKIVEGDFSQGYYEIRFKASDLPSAGVYYYTLSTGSFIATKRMVLVE